MDEQGAPAPLFRELPALEDWLQRGGTVLTPNRRLARALQDAWDARCSARGLRAWHGARALPMQDYWLRLWHAAVAAGELPAACVLEHAQELRLWRGVVESAGGFSLLGPTQAAHYCLRAHRQLVLWQLDTEQPLTAQRFAFDEDARAFLAWRRRFLARLEEGGWITAEMAAAALLALPQRLERESVRLLQPGELPPLLCALSASLGECREVPGTGATAELAPPLPCADPREELRAVARWCRERAGAAPGRRLGVVLQDMRGSRELLEMFLRREFDCVTGRYQSLPVNFATGYAMDRVPLVRDALRILALGAERVAVADLEAVLQSRFIAALPLDAAQLQRSLARVHALASAELPAPLLRSALAAGDGVAGPWERVAQLAARGRWRQRRRPPSQWLPAFSAVLEAWGWTRGRALDSLEHQQLEHWQVVFDALPAQDAICGDMGYAEALALLRESLAAQLFQPRTEDAPVQVLGPLETTGLFFDELWVAGLQAATVPAAPRPNPYLPRALQRQLGMPHVDHDWERREALRRFDDWRRSCRRLHCSYVAWADDAPAAPSPLLAGLPIAAAADVPPDRRHWERIAGGLELRAQPLAPVPLGEDEKASAGVGSAALAQQARCPFQAFAAQRLGAEPGVEPGYGLSPAERGTAVHGALCALFAALPDSAARRAADGAARERLLAAAIAAGLQALDGARRELLGAALLAIEAQRLHALLGDWLALEEQRPEAYRVEEREAPATLQLAALPLRLRLDRVDRFADGARLVIDYKTGVPESPGRWFHSPLQSPQLPLYALVEPPAAGVAVASLRPGAAALRGVGERTFAPGISADLAGAARRPEIDGMDAARAFWRRELESLAADFVAGDSRVEPVSGACRHCRRESLCRVATPRR